jgi:hypothetical protein
MHRIRRPLLHLAALFTLAACTEPAPSAPLIPEVPGTELPGRVKNYLYASAFPGATLGERITAAMAALPPSGGVIDATGYVGQQRIDRTIELGSATQPVELRLGSDTLVASVVAFNLHNRAKLIGNDKTMLTQANGANLETLITGNGFSDCEIAHLTVDGNRPGNTAAADAIALHTAKRCWLHHLTVQNTVGRLHPGIAFMDEGNEDNTIEYNLVQNIGTLVDYADGIYVAGPGNKVMFNKIRGATDFGIVGEFCAGCVIYGNELIGVPGGIAIGSGIANHAAIANVIDANVITGGNTTTWGIITIYRTNGAPPASTVVKGNIIRDVEMGHGIFVNGAEQVSVDGNLLANIGPTHPSFGIYVQDSKDVSIKSGAIERTGSFGIGIGNSANVQIDGVLITDSGRSGNDASGIGIDVLGRNSTSISLTRLNIFDRDPVRANKKMPYCIDFGQGGSLAGVLLGANLFDDGVNAIGCRDGTIRLAGASRVTIE